MKYISYEKKVLKNNNNNNSDDHNGVGGDDEKGYCVLNFFHSYRWFQ